MIRLDRFDFMKVVQDILEDAKNDELKNVAEELKETIDNMVDLEIRYSMSGLR